MIWRTRTKAAVAVGAAAIAAGALAATSCATAETKVWDAPLPKIERAASPEATARGGKIFRSACAGCHVGDDGHASGRALHDFPAFMGTFYAKNVTRSRSAGVGAWSDEELARMIKTTIGKDGKARVMPSYALLADDDVAAVIAFMRSDDPLFTPVDRAQPARDMTLAGNLLMTFVAAPDPTPRTGFTAPRAEVSVEYGRYMATAVYGCVGCHTPGMTQDDQKIDVEGMFGGGMEYEAADGKTYTSANITFDPTGIADFSEDDFARAVRDGVTRRGHVLRAPMPQFRWADDVDVRAIYAYLKTVPKVARARSPDESPRPAATPDRDPEKMFASLGCVACHGPGAPFADRLHDATTKDVGWLAAWIRDAQAVKPGAQMPTFASILDEDRALALAAWVKAYAAKPGPAEGR